MHSLIRLVLLIFALPVWALTATQVATEFQSRLEPFYATGTPITFSGVKGVRLEGRYFTHPSPTRGTILVVNGFGETFHKYVEVAYDLYARGYSVFLYDHRGQGVSQHLLPDPRSAYIDQFEFLMRDLGTYFNDTVKSEADGPYYLLAHSMGGLVSARYLEEHPGEFKSAVLSAPMLGINFHGRGFAPLKWLLDLASFIGNDQFYVNGPTNPMLADFAQQTVTHNEIRYRILDEGIRALDPQEMVWGNTARWVDQSFHAGDEGVRQATALATPTLLFQAGQDDLVDNAAENGFCHATKLCAKITYPQSRHEILMENDNIRADALARALRHFDGDKPLPMNENEILF